MSRRSQAHLRRQRGYDSSGRCAYEWGEHSRVLPNAQRAAAIAHGHTPPAIVPDWTLKFTDTGALQGTVELDFTVPPPVGTTARINWGDGRVTPAVVVGSASFTIPHVYAVAGTYRTVVTIGNIVRSLSAAIA